MSDSKLDFSKARPGDVLWSDKYGEVTINRIFSDGLYPVDAGLDSWTRDGLLSKDDATNDLHWSRPVFEEPPPPKRMKRVLIERRVHVVPNTSAEEGVATVTWSPQHGCPSDCLGVHHDFSLFVDVPEDT